MSTTTLSTDDAAGTRPSPRRRLGLDGELCLGLCLRLRLSLHRRGLELGDVVVATAAHTDSGVSEHRISGVHYSHVPDFGLAAAAFAAAAAMRARLGLKGGQLVANPIPQDAEIARDDIMPVIEQALSEAETRRIAAKEVTPFLLQRIFELTEGRSLQANIALVLSNARLAAQIDGLAQDRHLSPAGLVSALNDMMLDGPLTDVYLTMVYARLDLQAHRLRLVQAGHPHPFLQRADGRIERVGRGGLPVGVSTPWRYGWIVS